jgi:hypothetical protein
MNLDVAIKIGYRKSCVDLVMILLDQALRRGGQFSKKNLVG